MHFRVFLLGVLVVVGANGFNYRDDDLFDPFSIRQWSAHAGPFWQETRLSGREVEDATERDREPLAPDYKDPVANPSDVKPSIRPKPPSYDPSIVPGGVVDVDAGSVGFPSGFPDIHNNFGFSSSFGNGGPGGLFGLGGFFGSALPEYKPWWKGDNVCIEREETTDDEDDSSEETTDNPDEKKNDTERTFPNFFATSISLSNCHQTPNKYECVTKINNHGVVKTFTVRYKCCYGFERSESGTGCMKQVELKPLLVTVEEVGGKEFKKMIETSDLETKCKTENLTIFVPSDIALNEFTEKMLEMNKIEFMDTVRRRRDVKTAVSSKDLVLNHITQGFIDLNDVTNEQLLLSENNNSTIRMNIYPTHNFEKMITANCARVKKGNNLAENGIVHVIEGVVNPAVQSIQEIIGETKKLSNLKMVLQNTDLTKIFKDDGHYTIFAPTDDAFTKLDEATKQKILNGDACASSIIKHHIVAHTVCSSAIIGNATTHNIDGELLNLERKDDDRIFVEDKAQITQADIVTTNGVIHLIDTILIPDSALHINEALKSQNISKFQSLIEQAGLVEEIDNLKNGTLFAPLDIAFDDQDMIKFLDDIKDDKDKLRELIMYHTIEGQCLSCDFNNNRMLETKLKGVPLRINLYSTLPIFTNIVNRATVNCARIVNFDEKACGSTIHEVDRILMPPTKNILDVIENDEKFSTIKKIMKDTEIDKILQDKNQSITFLAPDNDAFKSVDEADMKTLLEDKEKATEVLKNHILTEVLCCSGVGPQTWGFNSLVPSLSNNPHQVGRAGNHQVRIGRAQVTKCDTLATNGLVHTINRVLFPYRQPGPAFGFFLFDI